MRRAVQAPRERGAPARRALGVAGMLLASAAAMLPAACADVGTGPADAVSISFDSLPPSIVAGDVLRDANGDTLRLRALAYNGSGGVIDTAPFRYIYVPARVDSSRRLDTLLVVDSITGLVRAPEFLGTDTVRVNEGRLAARLGPVLQLLRTIRVVQAPDSLARVAADSTLRIRWVPDVADASTTEGRAQADSNTSAALTVRVLRDSADADGDTVRVGVPRYLVRYTVVGGSNESAVLVQGNRQATWVIDTTDASGQAGPRLRVVPSRAGGTLPETILVEARAQVRGQPLAGSPVTFRVSVCRRGQAGC